MLKNVLERNVRWSQSRADDDPDYVLRMAAQQTPKFFWIGCSDSRVPANVVAGIDPGEVFVHRDVTNIIHSSDTNTLSALEAAVEALKVRVIIVCGHYGCGGVKAATENMPHGLADHWLEPTQRLGQGYALDLTRISDIEDRCDRMAELNVDEGVMRVSETPILRKASTRGMDVRIHGLINGLEDGLLRDLDCTSFSQR